ncbi:MAG: YdcF family protein [Deltaproteobacteria bacterium]|nr:YdcF family protein [Deltaproteobacteria bacterium]
MQKPLTVFILSLFSILIVCAALIGSNNARIFRAVKQSIRKEVIKVDPPAQGEKIDVIYILGGNQTSMELKSKTASEFFQKGMCNKIWIMSSSGITEYSTKLGRNWTKNEYAIKQLQESGIPEKNIELVKVQEKFFGTLSEAKDISSLIQQKQFKSILLIAQPYHTHRVNISFNKFLAGQNISLYIQDSGERMLLRHLIAEYIKFKIYQHFLI